jgi:DNA-binding transcriptional regulator YiaG
MSEQDWTPVVLKKRGLNTPKPVTRTQGASVASAIERRIDNNETIVKKKIDPNSIKQLIQARIAKNLKQENADHLCGFPTHTFRNLESSRHIPSSKEISIIQKFFGIGLRII